MKDYMGMAWLFLSLAATATALAIQEQQILAERGAELERVKAGYVACTSEFYLQEFNQATHRVQVGMMLNDHCLPTDVLAEYEYKTLNEGGRAGVERIRVFLPDDSTADLFVAVAAVTKGPM